MSLRPRFAGDGLLQLPSDVQVVRATGRDRQRGDVICALVGERIDPFERKVTDLLLAEAFARVDLSRPRKAREWYLAYGAVALGWLFPEDAAHGLRFAGPELTSQDTQAEILAQQGLVRWHLTSLARLTAHGSDAEEAWDPAWSSALLEGPDGQMVWLGAPVDVEAYRSPTTGPATPWPLPPGLPRLPVPQDAWSRYWGGYDLPVPDEDRRHARLGADRDGLLELQRRLIEPYLRQHASDRGPGGTPVPGSGRRQRQLWRELRAGARRARNAHLGLDPRAHLPAAPRGFAAGERGQTGGDLVPGVRAAVPDPRCPSLHVLYRPGAGALRAASTASRDARDRARAMTRRGPGEGSIYQRRSLGRLGPHRLRGREAHPPRHSRAEGRGDARWRSCGSKSSRAPCPTRGCGRSCTSGSTT